MDIEVITALGTAGGGSSIFIAKYLLSKINDVKVDFQKDLDSCEGNIKANKVYIDDLFKQYSLRQSEKIEELMTMTNKQVEHIEKQLDEMRATNKDILKGQQELALAIERLKK